MTSPEWTYKPLPETLAASISVALENASLFDDTRRLFREAKEARTVAEQANQAKSAFLSSMSHELRIPLNAIRNGARGIIGPVNQEQVELLDESLDNSKHRLNLIKERVRIQLWWSLLIRLIFRTVPLTKETLCKVKHSVS